MISEAQLKASNKYEKANVTKVTVRFNKRTEPELLSWIEGLENKQGYIKDLIRKDMEKHQR